MIPLKIHTNTIYKILFVAYLLSNKYFDIELSYLTSLGLFLYLSYKVTKINKFIFYISLGLLGIVVIGTFSSLMSVPNIKDYIRDFVYFTKPILVLLNVYKLISLINYKQFFVKAIVYTAVGLATFHFLGLAYYINELGFNIEKLRYFLGLGNNIEVIALALLFINDKNSVLNFESKYKSLLKLLLAISITLYFSRTDFILFLILFIGIKGYLRPKIKTIIFSFSSIIICGIFLFTLSLINVSEKDTGAINKFIYKLKNSGKEVFSSNIKKTDIKSVNRNWRAYEAQQAINQVEEGGIKKHLIGYGLGQMVDLKLEMKLGENTFRYIPILHNGYIYIYFKSGLIGLFIYVGVFISMFFKSLFIKVGDRNSLNLISAIILCILLTTMVITGVYNAFDLMLFYLAGVIAIYNSSLKANNNE